VLALPPGRKAVGELRDGRSVDPPERRHGCQGLEDEASARELRVRDSQPSRAKLAAAPQRDVEIENARAPATPAAAAELPLKGFEAGEQGRRVEATFDQRHCIGEVSAGAAMSRVEDDGRSVEQTELFVQAGDCSLDDACRAAEPAMRPV